MVDDRNDVRQALARPRASCEDVVPPSPRPTNRVGLVLVQPEDLALSFVLACPENPGTFGFQDSLCHQIVNCARILK